MGEHVAYAAERRALQRRTLLVLYLTYGTFYLSRKADAVVKGALHEKHGFSVEDLAASDTVYLCVYTVCLGLSGLLGNYVRSNVLLASGLVALAFTSLLKSQVTTPRAFAATQVLHAVFQSFGWPTCIKLVGIFVTENRGFVMGVWTTCQSLGGILGAVWATMMVARYGWQWAYLYHVPLMLALAVVVFLTITDDTEPAGARAGASAEEPDGAGRAEALLRKEDREMAAGGPASASASASASEHDDDNAKQQKPSLRRVLAIPGVVPISVAYFFLKFLRYALLMWLPFYYLEGLHFSQQTAGYMSSSFELGGMVGTPLIGYASDRYFKGRRDLTSAWFMAGASVMLVVCVAFAQGGVLVNATSMVAVGVLVIGPDSILSGTIAQDLGSASPMGPQVIGMLAGLINSVGSCGSIFQSYATAYISERYGWGVLFSIFVACSTLSALILFGVAERKRLGAVNNGPTKLALGAALACAALFAWSR